MKFIGLDGKTYNLDVRQSRHPMRAEAACKSKLQYRCGQILRKHFRVDPILEELHIDGHGFYFDFFIPTHGIAVEINGDQHDEYNSFFYKNKRSFLEAKERDSRKESLCEMNGWALLVAKSEDDLRYLLNIPNDSEKTNDGN